VTPASTERAASPLDDAWPSRYLAEELWLRGRRQVAFGLVRRGRFLAPDAMTQLAERHEKQGRAAYERLMEGLPPEDRAFLGSELMLGPASGMLAERAPIVLAFGAQVAEVLGSADEEIRYACARVNFLVSLFDLASDGEQTQDATALLEDGRLDAVLAGAAGCAALRSFSHDLPFGPPRVLGLLMADLFGDLHALRARCGGSDHWRQFERTVQRAYLAQARSRVAAGAPDSLAVARGKSVLPFLIMGELVALDAPPGRRSEVLGLAEALGEVFWRADDLADVGSDWLTGDVNSVLESCHSRPQEDAGDWLGISTVLESTALEEASDALLRAIDAALALMGRNAPRDGGEAGAWLTWYVVDWLR
jgi:hypothetical protein